MAEEVKSVELWRFCNDNIKTNGVVCHGYLEGKYFSICLETQNEISTWVKWHKRSNLMAVPNLVGIRADKLIGMILSRLDGNETAVDVVEKLNVIRQKNKNASVFSRTGVVSVEDTEKIRNLIKETEQKKAQKAVEKIQKEASERQERAVREAELKEKRRQERAEKKAAEKEAKQRAHEERMKQAQEQAQQRIRAQRALKLLQNQERTYTKMVLNSENTELPTVLATDDNAVVLGHLNNYFYRMKIGPNNPSFFIVQDDVVRQMTSDEVLSVLYVIEERLNQAGQYDGLLERAVSDFGIFQSKKNTKPTNILRERMAIAKNIAIQKGMLTVQNVLV
ncbi:MAG: hypothetical protein IJO11_00640 [Alphaproteobacteria bacterium]|nr:hypothetical protein [Alphaproteobacteria bacterium]